jgi:hypothetical protein
MSKEKNFIIRQFEERSDHALAWFDVGRSMFIFFQSLLGKNNLALRKRDVY